MSWDPECEAIKQQNCISLNWFLTLRKDYTSERLEFRREGGCLSLFPCRDSQGLFPNPMTLFSPETQAQPPRASNSVSALIRCKFLLFAVSQFPLLYNEELVKSLLLYLRLSSRILIPKRKESSVQTPSLIYALTCSFQEGKENERKERE